MLETSTYEVIVTETTNYVYRVQATSEESANESAHDKLIAGEGPLYTNREEPSFRTRLIAPPPPVEPVTPRRSRRKYDYLTTEETADELRVSQSTVLKWLKVGHIKANKLGTNRSHWRIPRTEVERLLRGE